MLSAVLGVVILSVRPSHACFVTNPKNLPAIFYTTWKGNPSSQMWFFVQLYSSWQDFNRLKGSRGLSAAAELLVWHAAIALLLPRSRHNAQIQEVILYHSWLVYLFSYLKFASSDSEWMNCRLTKKQQQYRRHRRPGKQELIRRWNSERELFFTRSHM